MSQEQQAEETARDGAVPRWPTRPLRKICAFISKGSTPTTYGFKWERDGVLFLRSECVSERGLDLTQSMFIAEEAHATLRRSEATDGDILITITGNVGRVVRLKGVERANMNQHIARIRVTAPDAEPEFVFQVLAQPAMRAYFASITTGQAYPQVSLVQVREAEVPFPPLDEQRAVSGALGDVDALLIKLDQLIAKKRDLKQGAMQQLLTGRTRLPGHTAQWTAKPIGSFADMIRGVTYRTDRDLFPYAHVRAVVLLRANNVRDGSINLDEVQFVDESCVADVQLLRLDDILICMANGSRQLVGKAARLVAQPAERLTFGAFMGCLRIRRSEADARFVTQLVSVRPSHLEPRP